MKSTFARLGLLAATLISLSGCGGGSSSSSTSGSAAGVAVQNPSASSTANNPQAAFSLVMAANVPTVTVNSPLKVNFAVTDSAGKHVPGLTLYNAGGKAADPACSGANVKLAVGELQADDTWRSLISNRTTVAASVSASGSVTYGATDPVETATIKNPQTIDATHPQLVGILTEHAAEGYYTYQAAVDVEDSAYSRTDNAAAGTTVTTNGLAMVKGGATPYRAALLLCYVDSASGKTVKVNPYIDFTLGADGRAVPYKDGAGDLTEVKKVVDRAACNSCHQNFAAHGGSRVEPQVCVICHNPGSQDFHNNGQSVDFKLMVHKFHRGKSLTQDYVVHNSVARKTDPGSGAVTGVTFPGEIRNCAKCHDGSATATVKTAQGDNWKTKSSKNACWSCHDDYKVPGSKWQTAHAAIGSFYGADFSTSDPDSSSDAVCANCHGAAWPLVGTVDAHAVPEWTLGEDYQYNIWGTSFNSADRTVTVEYSVSNPKTGADYDILNFNQYKYVVTNASTGTQTNTFVFAGTMYIGWGTDDYSNSGAIGRPWSSSCIINGSSPTCDVNGLPQASTVSTPNTNGAGGALIARGQPVALSVLFDPTVKRVGSSNRFTVTSTRIPESATGTGVAAFAGRINLSKDANSSYGISVKNVVSYFSLNGGAAVPRRDVVSTAKCEACHDKFIKRHGHGGSRNTAEVCVICHNANNPLNGTEVVAATAPATGFVTTGVWGDSAHFKRAVHMWHKQKAANNKDSTTLLGQGINFPAQTALTAAYGDLTNCNMCHVDNSYQADKGAAGTSRTYGVHLGAASADAKVTDIDPSDNAVISPKASSCSSCHDSETAKTHMMSVGGATFGGQFGTGSLAGDRAVTQSELATKVSESCNSCHAPGGLAGVDTKHGLLQ